MTATVRQAAGSLLVVGLGGTELTGLERAWLKLVRPAGIILFRRNISDARQTRTLLGEATVFCAAPALRCVDVEGGTVDRLRDALAPMPSAQAVARAALSRKTAPKKRFKNGDGDRSGLARKHGELVARAVQAFGFNTTLAPVLDLALPESQSVMTTRCAASTAAGVVEYARAFLAGLMTKGVAGCGKHFPGLGGGTLDSHQETPAIQRAWKDVWREDLEPYRALCNELPMVMVNHAAYPATADKTRPASVSKFWITTVLQKRIGYRGIVFSDDLEMGGVLKFLPMEEVVVEAVRAGADLLEICHSPELILRAYEALIAEAERSTAFRRLLLERARQSARKRARVFASRVSPALSGAQFEALRAKILRFSETIAEAQEMA
jgi:beta-N-acetylhexosaminidase